MRRALICVTLLIDLCAKRGGYGMALRNRKEVLVSTVAIPMCHLWSTDGYLFHSFVILHPLCSAYRKGYLLTKAIDDCKEFSNRSLCVWKRFAEWLNFVTYIVMLNKENVHLFLNCRWHIHSVSLNLISVLQSICPKQLCVMRKGCLCCV